MMIRDGFVTNSSSTNFMIISKEALTSEYLLEKLGFKKASRIMKAGVSLADDIESGIQSGPRWFEIDKVDYATILENFGLESAEKYKMLTAKGYHTYIGHINSDDYYFASFMTMDSFVIDEKDFYMDGRNCGW